MSISLSTRRSIAIIVFRESIVSLEAYNWRLKTDSTQGEHNMVELVTRRSQNEESGFIRGEHDMLEPILEDQRLMVCTWRGRALGLCSH